VLQIFSNEPYNALGQVASLTDRNATVHAYSFDMLGRQTKDAVTTLGPNVDPAVQRLETAYDTGGRAYLFSSYSASSGGTLVNQVQRAFNGLGQLS
jgi:YD repeat-containing protein